MIYIAYYFLSARRPQQAAPKVVQKDSRRAFSRTESSSSLKPERESVLQREREALLAKQKELEAREQALASRLASADAPFLERPARISEKEMEIAEQGNIKENDVETAPLEKKREREKEQWTEAMKVLNEDPQPANRAKAAILLGRSYQDKEIAERTVTALQKVWKEEAHLSVRIAAIKALGGCGEQAKSAEPLLRKIVFDTDNDDARRAAAESLLAIDRESAAVRKILRTALIGSKSGRVISGLGRAGNLIRNNRLWALRAMKKHEVRGKQVTTILIDVCEIDANLMVEGSSYDNYRYDYNEEYFKALLEGLWQQGQDDPRVLTHLIKYEKGVLSESPRAAKLRVKYDTLIKELQQK